eukprot:m.197650 g.197650  ORF g.197650 m.197650 type:complete len:61 (-) comp53767_c0_seq12:222-404(-)
MSLRCSKGPLMPQHQLQVCPASVHNAFSFLIADPCLPFDSDCFTPLDRNVISLSPLAEPV